MSVQEDERRKPLNRIRKATARAMQASAAVPQFTLDRRVQVDALLATREERRAAQRAGSLSDLLSAAVVRALVEHPDMNASFDEDAIVLHPEVNVGLAVALEDGLVVAAILDAGARSVAELAEERTRLDAAARAGRLKPAELTNTTFTISNLGLFGVDRFRAVVLPPQAGILAVGAVRPALVPGVEPVRWGRELAISLTCDHRAIDGAPAARFLGTLVDSLEAPDWLVTA